MFNQRLADTDLGGLRLDFTRTSERSVNLTHDVRSVMEMSTRLLLSKLEEVDRSLCEEFGGLKLALCLLGLACSHLIA